MANVHVLTGGIAAWQPEATRSIAASSGGTSNDRCAWWRGRVVLASVLGSVTVPKMKWLAAAAGGGLVFAVLSNSCVDRADYSLVLRLNRGRPRPSTVDFLNSAPTRTPASGEK